MAKISIPTLYDSAEFMVRLIEENCNNPDDLSRILIAVGKMLEYKNSSTIPHTLKQLIVELENKQS
jgi:hypothetical protein